MDGKLFTRHPLTPSTCTAGRIDYGCGGGHSPHACSPARTKAAAVAGAATGAVVGWPVGHIRTVSHEWMASQQMAVRAVEEASHEERPASRLMASLEAQVKDADEMVAYMQAEKARQEKSWRRYLSWTWWTSSSSSA